MIIAGDVNPRRMPKKELRAAYRIALLDFSGQRLPGIVTQTFKLLLNLRQFLIVSNGADTNPVQQITPGLDRAHKNRRGQSTGQLGLQALG